MNLEDRFHREMLRIYDEAKEFGYYATYFLRMVADRGGRSAAKHLLVGTNLSDGFVRLWEEDRLDLQSRPSRSGDPWSALFTRDELAEAQRRLGGAKYKY